MSENKASRKNYYHVSTDGQNRIDSQTIPLIVIPGFMGSRLHFARKFLWDYTWDPDDENRMKLFWVAQTTSRFCKTIHAYVPASVMRDGDYDDDRLDRGWGGPSKAFYGGMLEHLDGLDFGPIDAPVYAIGYDWRQSNFESASYVERELRSILQGLETDRFILLTHSMGGLVGRRCLQQAPDLSRQALGVVHIGQPAFGASVMYRRLFTGLPTARDGFEMRALLGDKPDELQRIASGIPACLQLLPTDRMKGPNGEAWLRFHYADEPENVRSWVGKPSEWYLNTQSPPGVIAMTETQEHWVDQEYSTKMRKGVSSAAHFHSTLGAWHHPNTWTISTGDMVTDHVVEFILPPKRPIFERLNLSSDHRARPQTDVYWKTKTGEQEYWHTEQGSRSEWEFQYRVETPKHSRDLGDHTVPLSSATDLLSSPTCTLQEFSELEAESRRQVLISGVEHSAMSNDSQVACALEIILPHLVGQRG